MTAKTTAAAGKPVKKTTVTRKSSKAAKTTSSKLTAAQKHTAHVKHEQHLAHEVHLTAIGKAPKVALARAGEHLPVCAFEAIAMSLRLAGQRVHEDEVAELWWLAGADPDGASVTDALAAAARFGLKGLLPVAAECPPDDPALPSGQLPRHVEGVNLREAGHLVGDGAFHALILGIAAPFPHAVLATEDGWWSWGELYSPWPSVTDEAWAVSWS